MPSLGRGQTSDCTNPVLDLNTAVGNPAVPTNVEILEFRIFDISTPAKRAVPVQVFPLVAGTYQAVDALTDCPVGHRLSVGRYVAEYTVDAAEPLGDHLIEWRFQQTALHPQETYCEEFYVAPSIVINPDDNLYCTVAEIRAEGFSEAMLGVNPVTGLDFTASEFDARVLSLIRTASRFVDKVTGRWFYAQQFDETNRFIVDGKGGWNVGGFNHKGGGRVLHLMIPVIRVDKLLIENQGLINPDLTEIEIENIRVYNRHLKGLLQPDDREDPRLAFIPRRITETVASGLFPAPLHFPSGRQNVHLEGVFGYTDPDGSPYGKTPDEIRRVTCRLVQRDLLLDSDECEKLFVKNKFRILSDKEGSTTIRLQELWLKGGITGDPVIDQILMMYKRPPRMRAV